MRDVPEKFIGSEISSLEYDSINSAVDGVLIIGEEKIEERNEREGNSVKERNR